MTDKSQHLCTICSEIDFASYFQHERDATYSGSLVRPSQSARKLGHLREILSRYESCSFCWLVIHALRHTRYAFEELQLEKLTEFYEDEDSTGDCYIYSFEFAKANNELSESTLRIGISTRLPDENEKNGFADFAGDIQLSAESARRIGKKDSFHGRFLRKSRVDASLIRTWLSICMVKQGERCHEQTAKPTDLTVVDVNNMCRCSLPQGAEYVALSYRWPVEKSFITTRSNVKELYRPGALKKYWHSITQTIKDAIKCVKEIGQMFLWVDAICIIQDDDDDKRTQIYQMDLVYGSAILTIINAPPNSTCDDIMIDNGLPGYLDGSRMSHQESREVKGLVLIPSLPCSDWATMYSGWTERAWTFQEELLSKRRLYFTGNQMYFSCSCSLFCEDTIGEGNDSNISIYPGTNLWSANLSKSHDLAENYPTRWLPRGQADYSELQFENYWKLLEHYNRRQMSNMSDTINAFLGILKHLEWYMQTEFWVGLPESHFDHALLWMESSSSVRRKYTDDGTANPFPSWSWAGWGSSQGSGWGIDVASSNIFVDLVTSEVDWYIIDRTGTAILISAPDRFDPLNSDDFIALGSKFVRNQNRPSDDFLTTIKSRAEVSPLQSDWQMPLLAGWTSTAFFEISGEAFDKGFGGPEYANRENLIISTQSNKSAGSIYMNSSWIERAQASDNRLFEFMLLSRMSDLYDSHSFYDKDVFEERDWCILNVMLIERTQTNRACRLGVGVIHEDAWIKASPTPMMVYLE